MKNKQQLSVIILGAAVTLSLALGIFELYVRGPLGQRIRLPESMEMAAEIAALFLIIVTILHLQTKFRRSLGMIIVIGIFTWCHQIFVPSLVSFCFVVYLSFLGKFFKRIVNHGRKDSSDFIENGMIDFLFGCSLFITIVCVASLFHVGGIRGLQRFVILSGSVLLAWELIEYQEDLDRIPVALSRRDKILIAVAVTMVLLQAGRMNIALDYDSLHYGLRSEYVLNPGGGIYENLGLNNVVYTYPKGLETLLLPLSGLSSYSFILSFNLWMAVGVLILSYKVVRKFAPVHFGWMAVAVISCIPAVMNMGITAKTDMITLVFQLMFLYFILCFLEKKENYYLILALGAFLITWIFKPTAMVFSAVVFLCAMLYLLGSRQFKLCIKDRWWLGMLPVAAAWIGIWGRTFLLVGVPITSIFTGFFTGLGFQVKYPFSFSGIPNGGGSALSLDGVRHLLGRLYGILFAPVGEDMAHVLIAWGSGLVFVLTVTLAVLRLQAGNKERVKDGRLTFLYLTLAATALISLVSVHLLWQVDGNYFILLYVLLAILAVIAISRIKEHAFRDRIVHLIAPVLLFNVTVTVLTNWSGVMGFSPVQLVHDGFYDHKAADKRYMEEMGNGAIWEELAANPQNRVLAVGEEPEVLKFPCIVQTYNDVTGSGGNVVLVKTLDNFKGYLTYADVDYIYVQARFVKKDTRVYDVLRYMMEDGSLTDVRTEYGNLIGRVNLDGSREASPPKALETFDTCYYLGQEEGL